MNLDNSYFDMVREPYRALLISGRTYAAFNEETTMPLIDDLHKHRIIIDPMAGYGTLMNLCAKKGISTFNVENNPPVYLWGVLNNPKNSATLLTVIDHLLEIKHKLPEIKKKAEITDEWFSSLSRDTIADLLALIFDVTKKCVKLEYQEDFSLAILIPFLGRLGCYVPGSIVATVKQGGICFYRDLSNDFDRYLTTIKNRLNLIIKESTCKEHEFVFGNVTTMRPERRFSAFITSPPYPNSIDYFNMFALENDCISSLKAKGLIKNLVVEEPLIGSVLVSKYVKKNIDFNTEITSTSARKFIKYISEFEGKKRRAKYDNAVYYVPYFANYFYQIERAYRNFGNFLTNSFEGYIVVTNNTARNSVIPVAESIVELFHELNIEAATVDKYTRELSHVGTINPKVKGFKAKHMEYTIKVWRT